MGKNLDIVNPTQGKKAKQKDLRRKKPKGALYPRGISRKSLTPPKLYTGGENLEVSGVEQLTADGNVVNCPDSIMGRRVELTTKHTELIVEAVRF